MKNILKKIHKSSERGQAIILIAASIVGLVAIVGLMVDGGILLIEYARLKRGIDSASIAAASQFRKPLPDPTAAAAMGKAMEDAGREFLKFNQSDAEVTIFTCRYPGTNHDDALCPANTGGISRKLVRITARRYVNFGFMRIVGMNGTWITASSIGEAASIDLVLAIDTSSSMAYETTTLAESATADPDRSDAAVSGVHAGDDPVACNTNPLRRCEPMGTVKDVAVDFVDRLFFPYDRVALIAFTGQETDGTATREPFRMLPFSDNYTDDGDPATNDENTEIQSAIRRLIVFQPFVCPLDGSTPPGPCLYFDPNYIGQVCFPAFTGTKDADGNYIIDPSTGNPILNPTSCGASNFGGGLFMAGDEFADARQDSFWVVIALIGGPANAAVTPDNPAGLCPSNTWDLPGGSGFCRDLDPMPATFVLPTSSMNDAASKAYATAFNWAAYDFTTATRHTKTEAAYDADDYARDGADHITSRTTGQGATLYSICMGSYCRAYPNIHDPASAELLGRYMAEHSGGANANHGLYFYSNNAAGLTGIFDDIAENIFTRISQ